MTKKQPSIPTENDSIQIDEIINDLEVSLENINQDDLQQEQENHAKKHSPEIDQTEETASSSEITSDEENTNNNHKDKPSPRSMQGQRNKKIKKLVIGTSALVVTAIVGTGAFLSYSKKKNQADLNALITQAPNMPAMEQSAMPLPPSAPVPPTQTPAETVMPAQPAQQQETAQTLQQQETARPVQQQETTQTAQSTGKQMQAAESPQMETKTITTANNQEQANGNMASLQEKYNDLQEKYIALLNKVNSLEEEIATIRKTVGEKKQKTSTSETTRQKTEETPKTTPVKSKIQYTANVTILEDGIIAYGNVYAIGENTPFGVLKKTERAKSSFTTSQGTWIAKPQ